MTEKQMYTLEKCADKDVDTPNFEIVRAFLENQHLKSRLINWSFALMRNW